MALKKHSLLSQTDLVPTPRLYPFEDGTKRVRLAASAGAELLPLGCPIAYNSSSQLWQPWTQPSDQAIYTITANATPASAGTFQLMIDGLASVHAFDVTAAAMEAELQALLADAGKPWSLTCAQTAGTDLGDASAVVTITFDEAAGAPSVDLDASGLTGNPHVLAASDPGTQLNGTDKIEGFIYQKNPGEEGVQLDASDDVLAVIVHRGVVYRDDVNTAAIRTVLAAFGAPAEAEMDAALRDPELRKKDLIVRGLTKVQ
jgi:hypothetical protein